MHRLVELQNKLNKSGYLDNPIIKDIELLELHKGLCDLVYYFDSRGDKLISSALRREDMAVVNIINARAI